ncbi:MAG: GYF domain-containing protein, partial [Planctomycetota bacterium]|nr:GYF domain-containing protein [Planctomycetota bacterium]
MRYIVRSVDGDEYGPFSRRELLDLVRDRRLGPGDFVRRETGRTWSPFERIAGLADTEPASAADSPEDPGRSLRIEPAPEVLEVAETETDEDDSKMPAGDPPVTPPSPDASGPSEPAPSPPASRSDRPSASLPNPFHSVGLPLELGPDEEVRFVLRQSFLDGFRESPVGGLLGHRSTMICTSSRIAVVRPSLARPSMSIVWLTGAGGATIETRRRLIRLLLGLVLLLQAFSLLVSGPIAGALTTLIPGANAAAATALGGF